MRDVVSSSINLITPGVRSAGVSLDDQKRVDTLVAALKFGATRLVIGRQVTKAQDPIVALDALATEIAFCSIKIFKEALTLPPCCFLVSQAH